MSGLLEAGKMTPFREGKPVSPVPGGCWLLSNCQESCQADVAFPVFPSGLDVVTLGQFCFRSTPGEAQRVV